ncbi:MAG: hypothetical protein EHM18_07840 [Acidobacteria bacterium]|nr:MAG: hypothetical protein EHM18_07840 [Acidobacteriota bacterium]
MTLLLYRASTRQLLEWSTGLRAGFSPRRDDCPRELAITELQADSDGRYVVFESADRLSSFEAGAPPFVYALDFRDSTPVKRFLGQGSAPRISADGTRIIFNRTVHGVLSTMSLDTRDWQLEAFVGCQERPTADEAGLSAATEGSTPLSRSPHTDLVVPLLPVDDLLGRERIVVFNPNSEQTVVTVRLRRGYLSWKRCFTLPAHRGLTVDPSRLRRGSQATLVGVSAPLPITAEYRVEETRSGGLGAFGIPALNPGTVASRLVFADGAPSPPGQSTLVLANMGERVTRVRVVMVDARGFEQPETAQVVTVRPRDLALVDLPPLLSGQVHVESVDQGQVAGALIIRDES